MDGLEQSFDAEQTARQGEVSGGCTLTQDEFKQLLVDEQEDFKTAMIGVGSTYEYTVGCKYE